ncbi:metallophosphoesterase [Geobacillus stearothermophilus]|uniref:metallophosphoesterase family protein n=1 Tax=Geobacillus stearothermophilus TaxID=1422 RepID=UPI000B926E63|nr:YfcE family phosphodiesterase [Geobacillus lituanicus]MED4299344.1 metallophosphoesterase [Geobacillus stearothermophilus]WJQ14820.1 metallophosphoesterase [Geobacillus stearothermophilus]
MKAVVVSDSHGLSGELSAIVERHRHEADLFIHCGDSELSAQAAELAPFVVVRGNCDVEAAFPNERTEEAEGLRFLITHGHLYGVKTSLLRLYYRAKETSAHVVCFGHSHLAGAEQIEGVLFINPGSIALPRGRKERTYAVLTIGGGRVHVQFYEVNGQPVSGMERTFSI